MVWLPFTLHSPNCCLRSVKKALYHFCLFGRYLSTYQVGKYYLKLTLQQIWCRYDSLTEQKNSIVSRTQPVNWESYDIECDRIDNLKMVRITTLEEVYKHQLKNTSLSDYYGATTLFMSNYARSRRNNGLPQQENLQFTVCLRKTYAYVLTDVSMAVAETLPPMVADTS